MEEVCPTEDMFMTLLDSLVNPYLPASDETPSLSQHQLVATQIHAVVVLYNYYHRKHHPSLEYLSFTSCCELAVIFKPKLLAYMKLMHQSNYDRVLDLDSQLSLTEEAIMGACKVSLALFALGDVPSTVGWPISKVAVLLVDSKMENCLLLFDSITKGIWSAIERDLDFSAIKSACIVNPKSTSEIRKCSRILPRTEVHANEDVLLQHAFSGIKKLAGIDNTDLKVLESHIVYSLNEEKTSAHFFIVQSMQSIPEDQQVHVKDLIESLQGPLVRKSSRGWMLTTVHQYFHLLPYTGILSDWFSREQLSKHLRVNVRDTVTQCSNSTGSHRKNEVFVDKNNSYENLAATDALNNMAVDGNHDTTKQERNDGCSARIFTPEKDDGDEFSKYASSNVKDNHPIMETAAMEIDKDVLPSDIMLMILRRLMEVVTLLSDDNRCSSSIFGQDKVNINNFYKDTPASVDANHQMSKIASLRNNNYV